MTIHATQIGAPDPGQRSAPIRGEGEGEGEGEEFSLALEMEAGVCWFNGAAFPIGTAVHSGTELLHGVERGLWVRTGP